MHGTPRGGGGSWRLELEGPNHGWPGLGDGHLWGIAGGKDGRSQLLGGFAHKRAIFQFCELKRHFPGTIVLVTSCGFKHRQTLSRVWEQFSFY